jgi:hypothetical protein
MEIIDNLNRRLGDDLKVTLTRGSKLRVAASTFSIYAFEALRRELEGVKELEFIFTAPTFVAGQATDRVEKQRREFYIPQTKRESSLYGSEFELRLRNKLTQRAIARECADWIKRKVTFKSNNTGAPMQQFAVIDDRTAYMPLQGFTSADLGYERGDAVSNLVNKIDGAPLASAYLQTFEQIWSSPQQVEDVTHLVHEHIASVYAENSPERIYFLILYNLFSEFLEDISEDVLPDDLTGWRDTEIWKKLYDFQRDAAVGIINKLETFSGCILATVSASARRLRRWRSSSITRAVIGPSWCLPPRSSRTTGRPTTVHMSPTRSLLTASATKCLPTPTCPATGGTPASST